MSVKPPSVAKPLTVVILAAGQGKRMNSDLPKVLQPLAGRPLLAHVIDTARALDPSQIIVVYGHGGERVREAFAREPVQWALQSEQLGTGHALMQSLPSIPAAHTVLVLYGDVPLVRAAGLAPLIEAARDGALAVLTARLAAPSGYGRILRGESGALLRIVEQNDLSGEQSAIDEVNTGFLAAPAERLRQWLAALDRNNAAREYYLTDVVAVAVSCGERVTTVTGSEDDVLGINDRVQLAQAEARYRRRAAEQLMLAGVTLADPSRIDVRGRVSVERDVFIDVNVVLSGEVRLGSRVRVGPNTSIRDSTLGAGTMVEANCVIDEAEVGEHCRIGPFARLRPGARLERGVHIGNFVEVKASRVGAGSKANHLSYLGDADIGAGVNVGAGTVTCNYDGANKWPTIIEDGAFIGSGSMLVAPLRIGANATVGAGSTVTEEVPPDKLTLARSRQVTIEGWNHPPALSAEEKDSVIERAKAAAPGKGKAKRKI